MKLKYVLMFLLFSTPVSAEVSFTFDDGYSTILDNGFPVLDQFHYKGTVYIITGVVGSDPDYMNWGDIDILHKHGWVIGSHSKTHRDFSKLPMDQVKKELTDSAHDLTWHGLPADHFAPPFGEFSNLQLKEIRKIYKSNRMAWFNNKVGLNDGRFLDSSRIQTVPLNENTNIQFVKRLIYKAARENVWVVFMIHRVLPMHSNTQWQISRTKLKEIVEYTANQHATVVTVDQYLQYHQ